MDDEDDVALIEDKNEVWDATELDVVDEENELVKAAYKYGYNTRCIHNCRGGLSSYRCRQKCKLQPSSYYLRCIKKCGNRAVKAKCRRKCKKSPPKRKGPNRC